MWIKLFPAVMGADPLRGGPVPALWRLQDPDLEFWMWLSEGEGLAARAGKLFTCASGHNSRVLTYDTALNVSNAADWHHFAFIWDNAGLRGVPEPALGQKTAVFVDGRLNSVYWYAWPPQQLPPIPSPKAEAFWFLSYNPPAGVYYAAYEQLATWNFTKTSFDLSAPVCGYSLSASTASTATSAQTALASMAVTSSTSSTRAASALSAATTTLADTTLATSAASHATSTHASFTANSATSTQTSPTTSYASTATAAPPAPLSSALLVGIVLSGVGIILILLGAGFFAYTLYLQKTRPSVPLSLDSDQ